MLLEAIPSTRNNTKEQLELDIHRSYEQEQSKFFKNMYTMCVQDKILLENFPRKRIV